MTTTFPPKPWTEGAVFVNDTTGVSYTYNGNQWLASGGPEVEGQYLPLTGGTVTGPLSVNKLFDVKDDVVEYQKNRTSILQMGPREIINAGILDNLMRDPGEYGYLTPYATKEYVDSALSPLKKLRFARDKDWNNLRPGEFGLMNDSNGFVGKWSEARQIYFLNVDSDGNRLMPNENAADFNSYLGSAFTAVTSSGERPVLRVATTGQAGGWVKLDYSKDLDLIYIGWGSKDCGVLMTGTNDNLSNGQYFLFNLPDLFF